MSDGPDNSGSTVFVIGAGASKEVNLPIGWELKEQIASILDIRFENGTKYLSGDLLVLEAMRSLAHNQQALAVWPDVNAYVHAGWRIRDGIAQAISIDNYLDHHAADGKVVECGKLAIATAILQAESRSTLYVDPLKPEKRPHFWSLDTSWFNSFFRAITENCKLAALPNRLSRISLIVFNYDRCVEHFLCCALQNYYNIDEAQAAALVGGIEIFHPYGTVGALPWSNMPESIGFGATPTAIELIRLSRQIKTFAEGTDERSTPIDAIRHRLAEARRVVFLGFAFHRMNVDLILPPTSPIEKTFARRVFGTGLGLSANDIEDITSELKERLHTTNNGTVQLVAKLTCHDLFHEFRRGLAFV